MIEWIFNQQVVLSISLVLLIVIGRLFTRKISAKIAYSFWLLIPLILLFNNAPKQFSTVPTYSFSRYVVSVNPISKPIESNWLLLVWLLGMAVMLVFVCTRYIQLCRSVGSQENIAKTPCYSSQLVASPIVLGFTSPKILVPDDFQQMFCKPQQKMIIEHEKIHIQHGDHLWNLLALTFLIVFWFNPLLWMGARSFRVCQELACDNQTLKAKSKHQKLLYAKALLRCAEQRSWEQSLLPSMGEKSTLAKRLELIRRPISNNKYLVGGVFLITTVLAANTLLADLPVAKKTSIKINDIKPSLRVEPQYPQSAAENQQEGSVILRFDITANGKTDNIEIVQSFPKGVI